MKRKILVAVTVLLLLAIAFWAGQSNGTSETTRLQLKSQLAIHKQMIDSDRSLFEKVITRPNSMTSGIYALEVTFPGRTKESSVLNLQLVNGQLIRVPTELQMEDIQQTDKIVSWVRHDMHEGPSARFMGLIDGTEMWGKVYVEPGQGWREGEPPAYGAWIAYPSSKK
jgi:hypothetical protein